MATHSSILGASLVAQESACNAANPGLIPGCKDPLGREGPLDKGMATLSSILAWRIPWTEEPGGLIVNGATKSQTQLSD